MIGPQNSLEALTPATFSIGSQCGRRRLFPCQRRVQHQLDWPVEMETYIKSILTICARRAGVAFA